MKSTVGCMKSRCLCVKVAKASRNHHSTYDHNNCLLFSYGSHLLHNALNQVRPFASSSSQAVPFPAFFSLSIQSLTPAAPNLRRHGVLFL